MLYSTRSLFAFARAAATFTMASVTIVGLLTATGCSKQPTATVEATATPPAATESVADTAGSEQVVSQFLDRIRRGGDLNDASALLTDKAQAELKRIGQPIQPIGSPDARFTVTRSEPAPVVEGEPKPEFPHRFVHCIWSEPSVDATGRTTGGSDEYQVVWSVARQPDGWRISGMIVEMSPQEPPLVLDFENGERMAEMLASEPTTQTATAPDASPAAPTTR